MTTHVVYFNQEFTFLTESRLYPVESCQGMPFTIRVDDNSRIVPSSYSMVLVDLPPAQLGHT